MINTTDGQTRRVGKYHHKIETKVMGVRLPAWKIDRARETADKLGMTLSEYMEWMIDTSVLRKR